jgi:acyl transferase domain-containing protein
MFLFRLEGDSAESLRAQIDALVVADIKEVPLSEERRSEKEFRIAMVVTAGEEEVSLAILQRWSKEGIENSRLECNLGREKGSKLFFGFSGIGTATLPSCQAAGEGDLKQMHLNVLETQSALLSFFWDKMGVKCNAVCVFSVGEVSAFYAQCLLAGLSKKESFAHAKSIILGMAAAHQKAFKKGRMLVIFSEAETSQLIKPSLQNQVHVGAHVGCGLVILTGENSQMEENEIFLKEKNIRLLSPIDIGGSVCFHCKSFFEKHKDEIQVFDNVELDLEKNFWYSSTVGQRLKQRSANFWYESIAGTAQSVECLKEAVKDGFDVFLELNTKFVYGKTALDCGSKYSVAPVLEDGAQDVDLACFRALAYLVVNTKSSIFL